jgi:hypothetical protein
VSAPAPDGCWESCARLARRVQLQRILIRVPEKLAQFNGDPLSPAAFGSPARAERAADAETSVDQKGGKDARRQGHCEAFRHAGTQDVVAVAAAMVVCPVSDARALLRS